MKYFLGLMLSLIMSVAAFAQNQISSSVFGSGATATSNNDFKITGTLGQPAVGSMSNNDNASQAGFWYTTFKLVTSIRQTEDAFLPTEFRLEQNYPNPFNPTTTISFSVPKTSDVKIQIFDVLGRRVATLLDDERQAGNYKIVFHASDLASGMYVYRIQAEPVKPSGRGFVEARKLMLLK